MALSFTKALRRPPEPNERLIGDRYLTDGHRLFRVVSQFPPGHGSKATLLEDCRTLEVMPYSPQEIRALGLRPVRNGVQTP